MEGDWDWLRNNSACSDALVFEPVIGDRDGICELIVSPRWKSKVKCYRTVPSCADCDERPKPTATMVGTQRRTCTVHILSRQTCGSIPVGVMTLLSWWVVGLTHLHADIDPTVKWGEILTRSCRGRFSIVASHLGSIGFWQGSCASWSAAVCPRSKVVIKRHRGFGTHTCPGQRNTAIFRLDLSRHVQSNLRTQLDRLHSPVQQGNDPKGLGVRHVCDPDQLAL